MATALAFALLIADGCGGSDKAASTSQTKTPSGESTGTSAPQATPTAGAGTPDTPMRRGRVVIMGTSLTAGLGLDPEKAYPALIQQKVDSAGFPLTIVNAGLSGETSAGALRRAGWVLEQPATMVILEVGANDGLRGVDPDSTKANLVALIGAVHRQQPGARVLLLQMEAPTNLGRGYTVRFHDAYAKAAAETGTTLLPFLLEGVAGVARLNQGDGIHPNAEGARRVANTLWKSLAPILSDTVR